jgi:hypothetical protein
MKLTTTKARRGLALGLVIAAALIGCNSSTAPGIQPEIANLTDNFQFQTSSLHGGSGSWSYTWQNTGTAATVNQSCSITGGTATLVVKDSAGIQVYSRNLAENGTFVTAAGTTGAWTIEIVFERVFAAAVNFRVQKQT